MPDAPISAFVIAYNEADRIGRTLASLQGLVQEIIVVDSGSTDGTQAVAQAAGARVIHHDWQGYGPQKRFAEEQCAHEWLLNLDADEVLSGDLRAEIAALFAEGRTPPHSAYGLHICQILPGQQKPARFAHRVSPIRLYNRRMGRYAESPVHDRVHMQGGSQGMLRAPVLHYSVRSFAHGIEKLNRYSTLQAADMLARKKTVRFLPLKLALIVPMAFLKAYFLRRNCLQGMAGFNNSMLYALSRFARLAKVWELQRQKPE